MEYRSYTDSFGTIQVQNSRLWGSQTQRSLQYFDIARDTDRMPIEVIRAFAIIKRSAAKVNVKYGLDKQKAELIIKVCDQILEGKLDEHFPLVVWQTGSGTQTNMNVNQVISNRAKQLSNIAIHPNNEVNMCQSSNDTFPTAMHIATVLQIHKRLLPALEELKQTLRLKSQQFKDILKIGRTHTQDATPITLGQQFSGYHKQIVNGIRRIQKNLEDVSMLAQGGTAVGTGLNTFSDFSTQMALQISEQTGFQFTGAQNKFEALSSHDTLVQLHGSFNTLAVSLMKIANDIRFLGSGPRAGLNQLILPQNQPGSSIMPGKVNPTQCEAVTMICAQVMGNNVAVSISGSNGHFQLNVFKPIIIKNIIHSIRLLSDGCLSFSRHCLKGIQPKLQTLKQNLQSSLMVVTALTPYIGYDLAGEIAKTANKKNITLRQAFMNNSNAAKALQIYFKKQFTEEEVLEKYKQITDPKLMLQPSKFQSK